MSTLHTRCPRCATTFRAADEHLAAAGGLVRCGQCDEVFDAWMYEVDVDAIDNDSAPPGLLNAGYIDDMLQENDGDRPAAEAAPIPAVDKQADATVVAMPTVSPSMPLVDLPVELGATPRRRLSLRVLGWTAALATLAIALTAQYAWLQRETLAQDPQLRARLEPLCRALGCQLPPYHDPAAIRSTELLVRPDTARPEVLLVDTVLENRAPFAQRYPDLELSFTDMQGKAVARRVFKPHEYLGAHPAPDALIASRDPIRVHLELKDPGEQATNYELRLIDATDDRARN